MHHAHILQGAEIYSEAPICHNLVNLFFDQSEGLMQQASSFTYVKYEEQLTSCLFSLEWIGGRFSRLLAAPFTLPRPEQADSIDWKLYWPEENVARRILDRLMRISDDIADDFEPKLREQLWASLKREVSISLNLIIRKGELWRIGWLLERFRPKHALMILKRLVHAPRKIMKR